MVYIRTKKISNKDYAYLVENISTENGPRQKVKKYLGRVYELVKESQEPLSISVNNKKEFLRQLVVNQLQSHGFTEKGSFLIKDKINFNTKKLNFKKGVLAINEGYLCDFTINRILEFKKTKDLQKDGTKLAKLFLSAGLPVSQEEFVKFYQML